MEPLESRNLLDGEGLSTLYGDTSLLSPYFQQAFVAEARIGNRDVNGTFELDTAYSTSAPVKTAQLKWVNQRLYNLTVNYNPSAQTFTLAAQDTVTNATVTTQSWSPTWNTTQLPGLSIRVRSTTAGNTITYQNLTLSTNGGPGTLLPDYAGASGGLVLSANGTDKTLVVDGAALKETGGFTLTGTFTMSWNTASPPANSHLAMQIGVGTLNLRSELKGIRIDNDRHASNTLTLTTRSDAQASPTLVKGRDGDWYAPAVTQGVGIDVTPATLTADLAGVSSGRMAKYVWNAKRTTSTSGGPDGSFSAGPGAIEFAPTPEGLEYVVRAGIDVDGNGAWTEGTDYTLYTMRVHFVNFDQFTVLDRNTPESDRRVGPLATAAKNMYITMPPGTSPGIRLDAIIPGSSNHQAVREHVLWRVSHEGTLVDHGNFASVGDVAGMEFDNMYTAEAGFDLDNSGTLDVGEVTRTVNVYVIDFRVTIASTVIRDGNHNTDFVAKGFDMDPDYLNFGGVPGSGLSFVPLQIYLNAGSLSVANAHLRLEYTTSDPAAVVLRGGSGTPDDPFRWAAGLGSLRIWRWDGPDLRNPNRVNPATGGGGDFFAPDVYKASDYALTENNQSIEWYVEGVNPTALQQTIRIVLNMEDDAAEGFGPQDHVHVTVPDPSPSTKSDWVNLVYTTYGLAGVRWVPEDGYLANKANMEVVYNAYTDFYNWATTFAAEKFLWMGAAHRAAGPVMGGLEDNVHMQSWLYAYGVDAIAEAALAMPNPIEVTRQLSRAFGNFYFLNMLQEVEVLFVKGNKAIFDDLAWQHEAYRGIGLDALDQAYYRDDSLNPVSYRGWLKIAAGTGGTDPMVHSGNLDLALYEQRTVLQRYMTDVGNLTSLTIAPTTVAFTSLSITSAVLAGMGALIPAAIASLWASFVPSIPSVTFPIGGTIMGMMANSPVPFGTSFFTTLPLGDLTAFPDRWLWIAGVVFPEWYALPAGLRFVYANEPINLLIDANSFGPITMAASAAAFQLLLP